VMYGAISSMVGVGLIVGTQLVQRAAKDRPIAEVVLGGLFALGGGAALLGAIPNSAAAALSTFVLGAAISFVIVPAQTMTQKETPPEMMGRVSSTFMSLFSLSQVLGMMLSGALATTLGIRQLFLACATALALLAVAGWIWLRPRGQAEPAA
jgi:MFS transporter, DHA3 family, macrolide efflux protein